MSQSSENSEKIKAEGRGGRRGRESGGVGVARAGPEEPGERRGRRETSLVNMFLSRETLLSCGRAVLSGMTATSHP